MNVRERFHDAIDSFYETNHYLASQVSRLGYPVMTTNIPTAGVSWDKDKKKIVFMFNPTFCDTVSDEEFNFTVAHEAAHVVYGHVFFLKSEIDNLEEQGADNTEMNKLKRKFNVAADCVVNDSLVNLYGLPRCKFSFLDEKRGVGICYGEDKVGFDCHELSVIDVMKLLPEENGRGDPGHSFWDSFFNADGSLNKEFVDAIQDFMEEGSQNAALSDQDLDDMEKLGDSMAGCSDDYARRAGRGISSQMRAVNFQKASLKWERIYFKKTERKKFEDSWSRRSRKLAGFSDDLILPFQKDREIEEVFLAIDISSSIDWQALDLFVSLARNFPKHFRVTAITFNTSCQPFDITSDNVRSGGGTNFGIIESYIQQNCKKYPKAVFVLTDGEGTAINPQHPGRWIWMLYGSACRRYCETMSWYKLEELIK